MPIPIEDRTGTDISGDPTPVAPRTRGEIEGATKRSVNRTQNAADPGVDSSGQQAHGGGAQDAGDVTPQSDQSEADQSGKSESERGGVAPEPAIPQAQAGRNPVQPYDWQSIVESDPFSAYHMGRSVVDHLTAAMGGNPSKSLFNAWNQSEALVRMALDHAPKADWAMNTKDRNAARQTQISRTARQAGTGNPFAQADLRNQQMVASTGNLEDPREAQSFLEKNTPLHGGAATVGGFATSIAANPLTYLAPEGMVGKLGVWALPGVIEALQSHDPNERNAGLAWAGMTGMLIGGGRLSGPMRELMSDALGRWPQLENTLDSIVQSKKEWQTKVHPSNWRGGQKTAEDYISKAMGVGEYAGSEITRVVASKKPTNKTYELDEATGKLVPTQATKDATKKLRGVFKQLGVEDTEGIIEKAAAGDFNEQEMKVVRANWKLLRMPYDLVYHHPGDTVPLRDPRAHLDRMEEAGGSKASGLATRVVAQTNRYLDQIGRGIMATHDHPIQSVWRSVVGLHRATNAVHDRWMGWAVSLANHAGVDHEELTKAVEGDVAAYDALPDAGKLIADSFGLIRAQLRKQSEGTKYKDGFTANWFPRVDAAGTDAKGKVRRAGSSTASALSGEPRRQRKTTMAVGAEGRLIEVPKYSTVQDANEAIAREREAYVRALTDASGNPLPQKFAKDLEAADIWKLAQSNPEEAAKRAAAKAADLFRPKETDFFRAVHGALGRQTRAIHSWQAMDALTQQTWRVKDAAGKDVPAQAAVKIADMTQRERQEWQRVRGYVPGPGPYFDNFLVHPEVAKLLERSTSHVSKFADNPAWWKAFGRMERAMVSGIMYSPMLHGINMLGRLGLMTTTHPIHTLNYFLTGKALAPWDHHEVSERLRQDAWDSGVIPPSRRSNYASEFLASMGDATGEANLSTVPGLKDMEGASSSLRKMADAINIGKPLLNGWRHMNDGFWSWVGDFGVMAYHIEKKAAEASGVDSTNAALWAAQRANTWMGHVAPEDTNPHIHELARMAVFSPNWFRTWAQLMVPVYRHSGVDWTPEMKRYVALNEAKMLTAAIGFQKMSGGALNWITSGAGQSTNLPGNQDKAEIRRPEIIRFLQSINYPGAAEINPDTGEGPKGERLTLENPLARQQQMTELASGFQTGHPGWHPDDIPAGLMQMATNRLSPLVEAIAAAGNVDLYQTVHDGQFRHVNADQTQWNPGDLLYGAAMASPYGSQLARQAAQAQEKMDPTTPWQNQVMPGIAAVVGGAVQGAPMKLATGLLGVNPPYAHAEKSPGQQPSDDEYRKVKQIQADYKTNMTALSTRALAGEITPEQWRQQYHDLSTKHQAVVRALLGDSPHYVNGAAGMAAAWSALYDKATANGELDSAKLQSLQNEFAGQHSHAEMDAMHQEMQKNKQTYPMLALYQRTMDGYHQFQDEFASSAGIDATQLRQELSEYGALTGDARGQAQYLAHHHELRRYQLARKRWEGSPAGMMYLLFYNPSVAGAMMRKHHETVSQLEEAV